MLTIYVSRTVTPGYCEEDLHEVVPKNARTTAANTTLLRNQEIAEACLHHEWPHRTTLVACQQRR